MNPTILCTRHYRGATWDYRSQVGVAYFKNGQIVTGLLSNQNENLAIEISHHVGEDNVVEAFHVFAGLYVQRIAKIQLPYYELFRFHRDISHLYSDPPDPHGTTLYERDYQHGHVRLGVERFQGSPQLADLDFLIDTVLNDRTDAITLPCPINLTPAPAFYQNTMEMQPHPGVAFEGYEFQASFASMSQPAGRQYIN